MRTYGHRRQVVLFLVAILLPCVVLIGLALRMIRQERELAEKRLAEQQHLLTSEIRQELFASLEKIKLQEVSALAKQTSGTPIAAYTNSAVALVAWVEDNHLLLPWEKQRASEEFKRLLGEAQFVKKLAQGERAEVEAEQIARAAEFYRQALDAARHPAQRAYARLLVARVLSKSGRGIEAHAEYRKVLSLPSDMIDEHGVSFALYAAARLLEAGREHERVLQRIRAEVNTGLWLPPIAGYLLQNLAESLAKKSADTNLRGAAQDLRRKMLKYLTLVDQVLALQNDFPNLMLTQKRIAPVEDLEPVWIPYGAETWLVSLAPALSRQQPALVAVRAKEAFSSLKAVRMSSQTGLGEIGFLAGSQANGQPLGQNFPGLSVAFTAKNHSLTARQWNIQRYFYLTVLFLILAVTLFGAYLLWRDVRRELRLAEMRSHFVSSVSHELKTPLAAIRLFAETLLMGRSANPQTQVEYLETIVNESERLTRLLNNVLDFSKIEQGQKIYRFQAASLPEVIQAAARAMQYPIAQQGFQLSVNIEDSLPPVHADADALEQAILNLLTNATKYSGDSRKIDLSLRRLDGYAAIQVTDHGVGIPLEEQGRIFEKFYRAPTPENRLIPGTGLGLTLVEYIAKAHGGRLEVRSTPGQGSTFSLYLPLEAGW